MCRYLCDQFRSSTVFVEMAFFPPWFPYILESLLFYPPIIVSSRTLGFKEASCSFLLIQLCLMLIMVCSHTQKESLLCSGALVHLQGSKGSFLVCTGEAFLCLCGFDLHLQMPLVCKHNKSNMLLNPPWSKTCCAHPCPSHVCSFCGSDRFWGNRSKTRIWKKISQQHFL